MYKLLIFLLIFTSCNAVKKAVKTFDDNPPAAALYCADRFPVRDTVIKGDTVTTTDTVTNMLFFSDTTRVLDTIRITITKPPVTITRTRTVTDTIVRENTARIAVMQNTVAACQATVTARDAEITTLKAEYDKMKDKRNWWRIVCLITWGVMGVYIFLKVKKILPV